MTKTLEILEKLVGFDTVGHNSNMALASYVEDFLNARGFDVHRLTDPSGEKTGLYAEKGLGGEGVLLSGHTDVVAVEGQAWTREPFRLTREGDRLYGRGTTDMKGFVASALALADRASRANLTQKLKLVLSYDEEVGCTGLQTMLDRLVPLIGRPRACLVGEPTEMQVASGHKGKAALRAVCYGQAGHSALAPKFANALYMATDFIGELRALQKQFAERGARDSAYAIPYTTIHVGLLNGGRALNIVPDRSELTFEYRHLPADCAVEILQSIEKTARRVSADYNTPGADVGVAVEQYNAYPGLDVPKNAAVIGYVQALAQSDAITKLAFGTEAGFFSALGIPTLVCGPGSMERQGHKPDEYIEQAQLTACDAMMDRLLDDLT